MVEYNVEPRVLADVYGLPKHITGLRKCVRPNRHDSYHCRHLEEMDECIQGLASPWLLSGSDVDVGM